MFMEYIKYVVDLNWLLYWLFTHGLGLLAIDIIDDHVVEVEKILSVYFW